MPSWESGFVEVNGLRLHYTRTGNGSKPPLVLAHGFSDDGLCWTPVAEALENDYDVVMVDARGHGKSDAPEHGYGTAEMAADLRGVIDALGLTRPAVLGHSMGGATALALAGLYPNVPGSIIIEDAGAQTTAAAVSTPTPADTERQARMRAWVTGLKRKTREDLLDAQRAETPHWSEAELGPWADSKLRLSTNVLNRLAPGNAPPLDWPTVLRQITCPVLLIIGDPARGGMVTAERAEEMRTLAPSLRVAHIPGTGHSIRRDRFEPYMDAVRGFLVEG
jgi:pimeloyl-ACP methyl ester carboxylesterase